MIWKLEILWVLALAAAGTALVVGDIEGGGPRLILGFAGSAGAVVYVILRGIRTGAARYQKRKRSLVIIIILISAGVIIASAGGVFSILGESSTLIVNFEIIGAIIFVAAVAAFILTLATAPSP